MSTRAGDAILNYIQKNGMYKLDFAKLIGITQQTVAKYLKKDRLRPRIAYKIFLKTEKQIPIDHLTSASLNVLKELCSEDT